MDEHEHESDGVIHRKKSFFHTMVALLTAVALFLLSIQAFFYLMHPEPANIPTLSEVTELIDDDLAEDFSSHRPEAVQELIMASRSELKQVANFIASRSCQEADPVCQSRALFYFVRDQIKYVPDGRFHDQLEHPLTVLKTGGADCEDMAVLLIGLQKAIGNRARLVFVPGHAYAQVSIPNYKDEKWLNLEATCKDCQFGELPNSTAIQKKSYHEV